MINNNYALSRDGLLVLYKVKAKSANKNIWQGTLITIPLLKLLSACFELMFLTTEAFPANTSMSVELK